MTKSKTTRIISFVLGLFLMLYAVNQFFHIIPTSYGQMPDFTRDYLDAILPFLPALYIFEILIGAALMMNRWVPFIIIILAPLSVNFLIFNFANGGWNIISAAFVASLNLVLFIRYREKYRPLFSN